MNLTKKTLREFLFTLCLIISIGLVSSCTPPGKSNNSAPFDFISADDDGKKELAIERIKDLEQKIDILEQDFRDVEPNIKNLVAIESDIQELIIELSKLTDGKVRPTPVPLAEVNELSDESPLSEKKLDTKIKTAQIDPTPPQPEAQEDLELDAREKERLRQLETNKVDQAIVSKKDINKTKEAAATSDLTKKEPLAQSETKDVASNQTDSPKEQMPSDQNNNNENMTSDIDDILNSAQNNNDEAQGFPTPITSQKVVQSQSETTEKEQENLVAQRKVTENQPSEEKEQQEKTIQSLGFPNQITDVRFGVFDGATRMVIDLSKGSDIDYDIAKDGNDILLAFAMTEWLAPEEWQSKSFDLVSGYVTVQTPEEVIMVINTTGKDMTVKVFTLPPVSNDKGPRLVVDFVSGVAS